MLQWEDITSPSSVAISVANHAPVLPNPVLVPAGSTGTTYGATLPPADTDLDGDPITYTLTGTLPTGLSFDPAARLLAGTPTQAGTFSLTYAANDGQGGIDSRSVSLTMLQTAFTITTSAGAGGSISPSGAVVVNQAASRTFAITPEATYEVLDVQVDGSSVGAVTSYTFTNVQAAHTIAATFTRTPNTIHAWSENAGWVNFFPEGGGVTVASGRLSGYAWGENIGWLRCQGAVPPASGPYLNTTKDNWGVNVDGSGHLSGYAWSENTGWIDFGATDGNAMLNLATGELSGYAWGENIGWIHLAGATYKVQLKL
jgi:hypothetical protein